MCAVANPTSQSANVSYTAMCTVVAVITSPVWLV
jgi:hypothetical protein